MYGYIYETTNHLDGMKYIGQHVATEFDPNYKGSGKYLWNAINKYGWDNFSAKMLCPCFSQEELDAEEIDYIAHCNAVESSNYYNLQAGGQTGNIAGSRMSDETKYKMRLRNLRWKRWQGDDNPSRKGIVLSEATKLRLSKLKSERMSGPGNPMYGKHLSAEAKAKISIRMSGENHPFYGKNLSAETKQKISESRIGDRNPGSGKIWINKNGNHKRVLPSELDSYLNDGWNRGRVVADSTRQKHRIATAERSRDNHGRFK